MSVRVTILGCGTSTGVPRVGNDWGACDPTNPKNRRRRCAILVDSVGTLGMTRILVDTPPDLREQLLDAGVSRLDGVLYSHDHADHTHGIDDLRGVAMRMRQRVKVWTNADTMAALRQRFRYCFVTPRDGAYPPILVGNLVEPGMRFRVRGAGGTVDVLPFLQLHGGMQTLGFRFGDLAYSSDINGLPEESYAALEGLDVWIVDALRYAPHPSHFSVEEALEAIARVAPKRAILTHMHIDLDYETLRRSLPAGVEPAYDGMTIDLSS